MIRKAKAVWQGTGRAGKGTLSTDSGVLAETPYSFRTRFEDEKGTNPEELIAAAHAGCFSMALSNNLATAGHTPERVHTNAKVHFERDDKGPLITKIDLECEVRAPGLDQAQLQEIGEKAKVGCAISRALASVPTITLSIKLI